MKAIGYIRVSKREQAESGLGLGAQREAIASGVKARGWELTAIHADEGISGGKGPDQRPGLRAALAALSAGKADALVVAKLDRLSRDLADFAAIANQAAKENWKLVALDLGVDTSTPAGEFVAGIMAAWAHFERRLIGERTKSALDQARKRGTTLGRPVDLPAKVSDWIVTARSRDMSLGAIAKMLNDDGIPTARGGVRWYASTVKAVLDRLEREEE